MSAPTQRVARLAVIVRAIAGMSVPNSFAIGAKTKVRTKKSKASRVQPKKPARTAWEALEPRGGAASVIAGKPGAKRAGAVLEVVGMTVIARSARARPGR